MGQQEMCAWGWGGRLLRGPQGMGCEHGGTGLPFGTISVIQGDMPVVDSPHSSILYLLK